MTRKEELKQVAHTTVRAMVADGVKLDGGQHRVSEYHVLKTLQQVEREVLERVAKHLEGEAVKSRDFETKLMRKGQIEAACEIQTQRITEEAYAVWVREQQKELG